MAGRPRDQVDQSAYAGRLDNRVGFLHRRPAAQGVGGRPDCGEAFPIQSGSRVGERGDRDQEPLERLSSKWPTTSYRTPRSRGPRRDSRETSAATSSTSPCREEAWVRSISPSPAVRTSGASSRRSAVISPETTSSSVASPT